MIKVHFLRQKKEKIPMRISSGRTTTSGWLLGGNWEAESEVESLLTVYIPWVYYQVKNWNGDEVSGKRKATRFESLEGLTVTGYCIPHAPELSLLTSIFFPLSLETAKLLTMVLSTTGRTMDCTFWS